MLEVSDEGGRENGHPDGTVWARLAAPVAAEAIAWRQDGKSITRDGRYFARFVCYIEANTVRARLDAVVPGEWDLTLDMLPAMHGASDEDAIACAFKARLQVLGVIREDVGHGKDYKQASTDAFKRAAVRFGVGAELYDYEQNWVEVDGEGKYAKPVEDPAEAYRRRHGRGTAGAQPPSAATRSGFTGAAPLSKPAAGEYGNTAPSAPASPATASTGARTRADVGPCPKCGGRMWDNRLTKRNPKAPDAKCRDRNCDGVLWPEDVGGSADAAAEEPPPPAEEPRRPRRAAAQQPPIPDDDIPF